MKRAIELSSHAGAVGQSYVLVDTGQVTVAAVDRGTFREGVHAWADQVVDLLFSDLDDPSRRPR